jgi:hypothetical protein
MRWILKKFWFPSLLIVLKLLSKKYPWAAKTHNVVSKVADPVQAIRSAASKK